MLSDLAFPDYSCALATRRTGHHALLSKDRVLSVQLDYSEGVLNDRGSDLHDDLEVVDLFDAAVPPDGLMSADSAAFLET